MTNLGLWAPFIDEQEMRSWYELPTSLQTECQIYQPDGHELDPFSESAFARLHREAVAYADQSVAYANPPFHNHEHFRQVEENGLAAADAYANGNRQKLPEAVRQALSLALYMHDAHHCASTFRVDARHGLYRPELGVNVSLEWVTTGAANEFMTARGLCLPARLFQVGIIWASTYGGQTPKGRELGIPNPQPQTVWGCITRAADVCPQKDFTSWLRKGIAVNYGEIPAAKAADTWHGFFDQLNKFVDYVEHCMNRLDTTAQAPITVTLGWRKRIITLRQGLAQLKAGDPQLRTFITQELRQYNATLG